MTVAEMAARLSHYEGRRELDEAVMRQAAGKASEEEEKANIRLRIRRRRRPVGRIDRPLRRGARGLRRRLQQSVALGRRVGSSGYRRRGGFARRRRSQG